MQKLITAVCVTLLSIISSQACDVCGCNPGSGFSGILPQFQKSFVGMRWEHRTFTSQHLPSLLQNETVSSRETFDTWTLWGRFYPTQRIQLLAFVPFQNLVSEEPSLRHRIQGMGDASVMANYQVINTGDSLTQQWKHALLIGGGVKLPTGSFDEKDAEGIVTPNLQPGTGAWDVLLNANYTLRKGNWGVNSQANYRITGMNVDDYKFGNSLSITSSAFYWVQQKNWALLPNVGFRVDQTGQDTDRSIERVYTGGTATFLSSGADVYINRSIVGFSYLIPLSNNLSEGLVTPNQTFNINLSFIL